jgi:hypothetical protein
MSCTGTATSNALTMGNYAPVNSVAPVVSGTAVVSQVLTTTNGAWDNSPTSFSYQWKRGATNIGTNSSTYTLVQADAGNASNITCVVTATNAVGSADATSNTIAQILDATWNDFKTTLSITDSTINSAMNTYTITRKSISATASLGAYPMVGGTDVTHSRNLYNPANTDAAKRILWAGTVTHNSNGVQGNGVNGTGDTFINGSTEFPTNDFTVVWYSRSNLSGNQTDFGVANITAGGLFLSTRWSDNNTYNGAHSTLNNAGNVIANTSGCFVFKRIGNSVTLTKNGTLLFSRTDATSIKINNTIRVISRFFNLSVDAFSARQYTHFEFLNFGLNSTQETNIINAVIAKETALSRNV